MGTFRPETAASTTPPSPTLNDALARLAALAGLDPAALLARLPAASGASERDAFLAAIAAVGPLLQPLRPSLGGSLLGRYLGGALFDGEVSARTLPKEAKKALKDGDVVASSDADVWIFVDKPGGHVQVCHAHPESFRILGESVPEWLAEEAAAVEAARRPKPKRAAAAAAGKPVIDEALARLVELSGGGDVRARLAALKHASGDHRWKYLTQALKALGKPWSPAVLGALEGRLLGRLLAGKPHDTDDEVTEVEEGDDDLDGINPVYVKRYPKAAWKLIAQVKPTCFVASSGPEIWFILWEAKGAASSWNISVHHAAYEGYELISPTLEGWLTAEVARVEAHARDAR